MKPLSPSSVCTAKFPLGLGGPQDTRDTLSFLLGHKVEARALPVAGACHCSCRPVRRHCGPAVHPALCPCPSSQHREAPAQLCRAGQAPRLRRRGDPGLSLACSEQQGLLGGLLESVSERVPWPSCLETPWGGRSSGVSVRRAWSCFCLSLMILFILKEKEGKCMHQQWGGGDGEGEAEPC